LEKICPCCSVRLVRMFARKWDEEKNIEGVSWPRGLAYTHGTLIRRRAMDQLIDPSASILRRVRSSRAMSRTHRSVP
jgi:hypothetical protein